MVMKLKPERVVSSYSFAVKVDGVEKYIGCCVLRQRVEWRLLSR